MTDSVETFEHKGLTVRLECDLDPTDPREDDNFGTMVCWHNRYRLGDKHDHRTPSEFRESVGKDAIVLPLYLYDHSGITMSCAPFSCPWDSGQVGYVYATLARVRQEYGCKRITQAIRDKAIACLTQEVSTYDEFLTGQVYGYVVEDSDGEHIDSCWGFYGLEYCREEARGAAEYAAVARDSAREAELIDCD